MTNSIPGTGTITAISTQQKFQNRVNIYIDESFAFGLHMDIVVAESLSKGVELSEDRIQSLLEEDSYLKAREKALYFIGYRSRSIEEVRARLSRESYGSRAIERVIERLLELNMLDDRIFAREFVKGQLGNKGYGPMRIRQSLKNKGIADTIIETELNTAFKETDPEKLAAKSASKIFLRLSRFSDSNVRKRKLSDYLSRRGFRFDQMDLAFEKLDLFITDTDT